MIASLSCLLAMVLANLAVNGFLVLGTRCLAVLRPMPLQRKFRHVRYSNVE
jgi:hypothetical protein